MSRKDKLKHGQMNDESISLFDPFDPWNWKRQFVMIYYWAESQRVVKLSNKPILLEMWKINNHSVYFLTPAAAVTICRRDHIDCQSVKKLWRPYRSMRVAGGGGTKSACLSKRLLRAGGGWEVQKVCSRRACGAVFQSYYIYHNLSKKLAKTVKNNIEIPALVTLLCVFSF